MNKGFVRVYLRSAAVILAVTALGKGIPIPAFTRCIEEPLFGSYERQFDLSNEALLGIAFAIELGIFLLICFSRRRWLPCLAAGVWGAVCLFVREALLDPNGVRSCNCLGWFQIVLPLPPVIMSTLFVTLAGWLMLGGFAAFALMWTTIKPRERVYVLASALVLVMCLGAFLWYLPPQPVGYGE